MDTKLQADGARVLPTADAGARPLYRIAVAVCLLLGVAVRVYGAWAGRYITDPDSSVVALMVKHMAAGAAWPVFFYGQAYMGSLEPTVSAVLCRLFGTSGFLVCLGTALLSAGTLLVVWLWARAAGGRATALAALALCVIGPFYFCLFQFAPRGGYMATLLLGLLVLWLGGEYANAMWRREIVSRRRWLLLGLLSGLGWWTNPLVLPELATAALVMVVGARGRPPWRAIGFGGAGFLIGGLPFWVWNARHDWASFAMAEHLGGISLQRGASLLVERYKRLLNPPESWPPILQGLELWLPVVLLALGMGIAIAHLIRRREHWNAHLLAMPVFLLLSAVLFARSFYATLNTARYLVPWVPVAAILIGLAIRHVYMRGGLILATAPVLLMMALQVHAFGFLRGMEARVPHMENFDAHFERFLTEHGITAAYGHFMNYPFNFNLDEKFYFTSLRGERYLPIARGAELADRIALLDNTGQFTDFMAVGGGTATAAELGGKRMHLNFQAPTGGVAEISASAWTARDQDGVLLQPAVADRDRDTAWRCEPRPTENRHVEIVFGEPRLVRMVRMQGVDSGTYPRNMRVEILPAGSNAWEVLYPDFPFTHYFWSGPRLYNGGPRARAEMRLPDIPLDALRFVAVGGGRGTCLPWAIAELECYGPGADLPTEVESLPALLEQLTHADVRRLYSDRWVANRVHAAMGDAVALMLEPPAFPDSPLRGGERVRFDAGTALLVPAPELATTRDLLKRHGLAMHEWAIGPWVLLQLPSSATVPRIMPPLVWTGYGLRAGAHRDYAFALLADAAARQATAADVHSVLEDMELAVRAYPGMIAAAGDVLPSLERHAPGPRTAALMDAYRRLTQPPVPTAARFAGDIALLGLDVRTPVVHPGGQAEVVYYWRSAAGPDAARWSVFANFRQAEKRFQDDRLFAAPQVVLQREVGAEKEVFQEVRRFTIPEDAAEGEWELLVGLYDGRGHRARATGYGKFRARGLRLPAVIRVQVETNAVPETSRP